MPHAVGRPFLVLISKVKYCNGFTTSKGEKPGTDIQELRKLTSSATGFTEQDIIDRNQRILDGFLE